jgi:hypothetical protein
LRADRVLAVALISDLTAPGRAGYIGLGNWKLGATVGRAMAKLCKRRRRRSFAPPIARGSDGRCLASVTSGKTRRGAHRTFAPFDIYTPRNLKPNDHGFRCAVVSHVALSGRTALGTFPLYGTERERKLRPRSATFVRPPATARYLRRAPSTAPSPRGQNHHSSGFSLLPKVVQASPTNDNLKAERFKHHT